MILPSIETPADLRFLDDDQLHQLAAEIRTFIVDTVTTTGGHLGSNLGVVELTLALHRVFESPRDVLLWDTGHQAYVHKLLTGRRYGFKELKRAGGLSGYPSRAESEHDWVENSHASTALSYAHGLASAFELSGDADATRRVVAVVGDGALTGGMAYEALNNLGHSGRRVLVVLNDNGRSYAPTVSHLSHSVTSLRLNPTYIQTRRRLRKVLRDIPAVGELAASGAHGVALAVRELVTPHTFFEALGVRYAGPIDGHDVYQMEQAFAHAAEWDGPIVVHVLTQKGRGYAPAEEDDVQRLHDVKAARRAPSENVVGTSVGQTMGAPTAADTGGSPEGAAGGGSAVRVDTYTDAFTRALVRVAGERPDVVALTAAMPGPTGLLPFQARYPDRFFDVGIAEQHELTAAAGMAMGGLHPVVAVYSTFFSRAFDQANLDVGLHGLPVTVVLDRAGITGDDGPSHHGLLDLVLTLAIPGMTVFAPSSAEEVDVMLETAVGLPGPASLRFPKTPARHVPPEQVGRGMSARCVRRGDRQVCLLGVGKMVAACEAAATELATEGIEATVWDVRVVSPPDPAMLADAAAHRLVVTAEDGVRLGGAGMFLVDAMGQPAAAATGAGPAPRTAPITPGRVPPVRVLGVPRSFLAQGRPDDILARLGLDGPGIARSVRDALAQSPPGPGSVAGPGSLADPRRRSRPAAEGGPACAGPGSPGVGDGIGPDEVVDHVVRVDRLPGVTPEPLEDVVGHRPLGHVVVVDVGDLELPTARRLKRGDDREDLGVVAVDAGDPVGARRDRRLFLDAHHPAGLVELGDPEVAQVLGLGHLGQQDPRAGRVTLEGIHHGPDRALDHVVGQHHEHRIAADEPFGEAQGLGDAARPLLVAVGQPVDPELVAVAQQAQELAGVGTPGDQHDLGDPCADQCLDGPLDHRPVVDRQQVLVGDPGQRVEPGARASGQQDALHERHPKSGCGGPPGAGRRRPGTRSVSMERLARFAYDVGCPPM